jgi:hypothetical protein
MPVIGALCSEVWFLKIGISMQPGELNGVKMALENFKENMARRAWQ